MIQDEVVEAFQLPHPEEFIVSSSLTEIAGNEIKRFIMALQGYVTSPNPILPLSFLIEGILNKDFATVLKKTRTAYFTRSYSAYSVAEDDLDQYLVYPRRLRDIGDVFNYKYWLRWSEDDPCDYLWGRVPVVEPPDLEKKFWKDCLYDVLPDELIEVKPEEILLACSSSGSVGIDGKPSKVFLDKSDPRQNYFSREPLKGKRTVVYKGPTEVRDCITLPICQSNTIKWIEKQMSECCRGTTYSAFGKDPEEFEKLLDDFYDPTCWFFNRDLTKEGITKPRWMLKAIQEVCKEKFPGNPIWDFFDIYSSYTLVVNGIEEKMLRGHGLGMANALTTIMQCATFRYVVARGLLSGDVDALFYNDDATFKGQREDVVISLAEDEREWLGPLGLIPKDSKTYISKAMVLCERYYPKHINEKVSYSRYIRRLPFAATNIVAAKSVFHTVDDPCWGPIEIDLFPLLLRFWGVEYSHKEFDLPWWAGGWCKPNYKGVDLSFLHDWTDEPQLLARGFRVGPPQLKPPVFRKEKGYWMSPVNQLPEIDIHEMDHFMISYYGLLMTRAAARAKYHRSGDDISTHKWLRYHLLKRYQIWCTPAPERSMEDYYCDLVKTTEKDIIPPIGQCRLINPEDVLEHMDRPRVPVRQPNKLVASLLFWTGCKYKKGVIPYPYPKDIGPPSGALQPERLSAYNESIMALPGVTKIPWTSHFVDIMGVLKERNYYDDYRVMEAYTWATGDFKYPRPLTRSPWGDEINRASKYLYLADKFGTEEAWDCWMTFSRTLIIPLMFGFIEADVWEEALRECGVLDEKIHLPQDTEEKKEEPPSWKWEDLPSMFWHWRDTRERPSNLPALVIACWEKGEELFERQLLWKGIASMSSTRKVNSIISEGFPEKDSMEDKLIRKTTGLEYAEVGGFPVYQIADLTDQWAGSDSEEGGAFGLFDGG